MNAGQRGRLGEKLAAKQYKRQGFRILETNYCCRMGEVDIIAQKGSLLVFCEVKTRAEGAIAAPREWVNAPKQARVVQAAQHYLAEKQWSEPFMRFDVAEVILPQQGKPQLTLLENAFGG